MADLATPPVLAAAFAAAAVIGVGAGLGIGLSALGYRTFRPIVLLLFSVPKMVMLPRYAFSLGVFPILLNAVAGTRMVDRTLVTAAYCMGASRAATTPWYRTPR